MRKFLALVGASVVFFNVHGSRVNRVASQVFEQYDRMSLDTQVLHAKLRPDDLIRPEHIMRASRDLEVAWRLVRSAKTHQEQLRHLSNVRGFYEMALTVYNAQNARRARL